MEDSVIAICEVCGDLMPEGEEMFNYHGYSGPCPRPPPPKELPIDWKARYDDFVLRVREIAENMPKNISGNPDKRDVKLAGAVQMRGLLLEICKSEQP